MIACAGAYYPLSDNYDIPKFLGTRHRAAIGMSEVSDALIIVVSEETGMISVAENGRLDRGFDREKLSNYLLNKLLPESTEQRKAKEKKKRANREKKDGEQQ